MASTGSLAIQSISWRGLGAIIQLVLGFAFTLILMKYLSPDEYGIVAKIYIILSLFNVFLDFGFSQGIIQSKQSSREFLSSHFFLSLVISIVLALLLAISAKSISLFYEVPELKNILYALSFNLVAGGMIIIHRAYMHKKLKFKQLSIINLVAFSLSGFLAIILAHQGFSFYAIVAQIMSLNFIQVVLIWFYSGFRPKFYFNKAHIKETTNFSVYIFISHFLIYVSEMLDQFLSSLYFSHDTLGKYNRSISLTRNPVKVVPNTLSTVLYPLFAHSINDKGVDKNENLYMRSTCMVFHIIAPLLLIIYINPQEITRILLPEAWWEINNLIRILSLVSLLMILELEGPLFLSKGKSKEYSTIIFINKLIRIICIFIGIRYGIIALLYALLIAEICMRIVSMFSIRYFFNLDLIDYFKKLSTSFTLVLFFALLLVILKYTGITSDIKILLLSFSLYLVYLFLSYFFKIGQAGKDLLLVKEEFFKRK